jgi:hypothetical protein
MKYILDLCVTLSARFLYLWWLCYKLYTSAFTKVSWVDLTEAAAGGTAAQYGRALPIPVLARASDAWLRGLFDLRELVACKSSLISLNFSHKVSKSAKEK